MLVDMYFLLSVIARLKVLGFMLNRVETFHSNPIIGELLELRKKERNKVYVNVYWRFCITCVQKSLCHLTILRNVIFHLSANLKRRPLLATSCHFLSDCFAAHVKFLYWCLPMGGE